MTADVVEQTRRALGRVGAALPSATGQATPVGLQRDAARRLEQAGYNSVWVNEVIGKDALVQAAVLLAATDRLVVGTGIANMWARPAQTTHAAAAQLAEAYPGRFVLGLGVGWPQQAAAVGHEFGKPLATLRDYLDRMDALPPGQLQVAGGRYARIVGANGPNMLTLAGQAADGAVPAMRPPPATRGARRLLGPDRLLVVLLDASSAQGTTRAIAQAADEHLRAGADHVVAGLPMGSDVSDAIDQLVTLGPVLANMPQDDGSGTTSH